MRTAFLLRAFLAALSLAVLATPADAQRRERDDSRWLDRCRDGDWGDDERFCEVRDVPYNGNRSRLVVDGEQNGGVTVIGWERNAVQIRARIQANARSESEAREIARDIRFSTDGTIRAAGPERVRRRNWSVSYIIYAPQRTDLDLTTFNGGISIEGVEGSMRFNATNGGIHLDRVGGDVRGETTNGGLHVTLDGARWRGQGLDVRTTNGGVHVEVPARYSAELETGTVNGGFDIDFPITLQGRFGRRITTTLGDGGPRVRMITTNGGVSIRRAG
ncbi:MAG: DUF4097 family beta strand repeat-containing protein [Gemmatimonadaceae bacterium]